MCSDGRGSELGPEQRGAGGQPLSGGLPAHPGRGEGLPDDRQSRLHGVPGGGGAPGGVRGPRLAPGDAAPVCSLHLHPCPGGAEAGEGRVLPERRQRDGVLLHHGRAHDRAVRDQPRDRDLPGERGVRLREAAGVQGDFQVV